MDSEPQSYDVIIIGGGMSGMAAAIRSALFDKKVLLLEKESILGGLNGYYARKGVLYDVGLHAVTNFTDKKAAPLNRIFRQLRLSRESFGLCPQLGSKIIFPDCSLSFSNDFSLLLSEIEEKFPKEIDNFIRFNQELEVIDPFRLEGGFTSTRTIFQEKIKDPLLREMLLLPIFYYGSAWEEDIDFSQFVILFFALYREGFARPFAGVRTIISALKQKLKDLGVEIKLRSEVVEILLDPKNKAYGVRLVDGKEFQARTVISSAGKVETSDLCQKKVSEDKNRLSFVESIAVLKVLPDDWEDTIYFFSQLDKVAYRVPEMPYTAASGVICIPNNYDYGEQVLNPYYFRVTALANYHRWKEMSSEIYKLTKQNAFDELMQTAQAILPPALNFDLPSELIATDTFTPLTIERYTGHIDGGVYGSPDKQKQGTTSFKNLFLCGTDQGFLGITGALSSGIAIVNEHILR